MTRPLGPPIENWTPPPRPDDLSLSGRYAALAPLDPVADAAGLWAAFEGHDWVWDYLYGTAPADRAAFDVVLGRNAAETLRPCYVVRRVDDPTPLGYACFYTVVPDMGCIEIGNVNLSPALQRSPAATEAFFLMIDWAFANGYRRVEWKCNALNCPSRVAAQRLGFSFEGIFRQHLVVNGRNRDTAWFAMTDGDWRGLRAAFLAWLAPANFDAGGQQKGALKSMTAPLLFQVDPSLAAR